MIIEKDIKKVLSKLASKEPIQVPFEGSDILISFLDDATKLSLMTTVYFGGNYIPASVRHCLSYKSPFSASTIRTFLTIDEQNFQVRLHYLGHGDSLNYSEFKDLLEEFGDLAEKWRIHLDQHDRNDLVYINVR